MMIKSNNDDNTNEMATLTGSGVVLPTTITSGWNGDKDGDGCNLHTYTRNKNIHQKL